MLLDSSYTLGVTFSLPDWNDNALSPLVRDGPRLTNEANHIKAANNPGFEYFGVDAVTHESFSTFQLRSLPF